MTPHDENRLTAYALGELAGDERAEAEALLREDPAARAYVDDLHATAARLRAALAAEAVPSLSEEQRTMITCRAERTPHRSPFRFPSVHSLAVAACIAAAAALAVALFMPSLGAARRTSRQMQQQSEVRTQRSEVRMHLQDDVLNGRISEQDYFRREQQLLARAAEPSLGDQYFFGIKTESGAHIVPAAPAPTPDSAIDARRYAPPSDREAYDRISDNPFLLALDNPLSTFSVDVDTASYANVRRFLLGENRLPPPDAVRIEELVNYFDYDYTAPADNQAPFAAHVEVAAAPWQPKHRLVRIGLKGYEVDRGDRGPANLVFLLDVSGSMDSPDKLPLVKAGMKRLIEQLRGDDRVAIAVYAGASGLVLESTRVDDGKQRILDAIDRLSPGGSTNGAAGIELAYQQAVSNFREDGVNRVILCTDGDFNVGITDRGQLTRLIEEKARSRVYLSVLGFGTGNLQDATMEELSRKGDGNYAYIDSLREAEKVLVEQAGGTLVAIAKDVKVQVEFNPAKVSAYRLIGYENRLLAKEDFNDDLKDAGDIGSGHTVTALYEIVPVETAEVPDLGQNEAQKQQRIRQLHAELASVNARIIRKDAARDGNGPRTMILMVDAEDAAELQRIQAELASLQQPAPPSAAVDPLKYQQPAQLTPAAQQGDDLLTLKLRYKAPDAAKEQGTSKLIEFPVADRDKAFADAGDDFRFAAAVAGFGMLLRDSPHKGGVTFGGVFEIAQGALGADRGGYRGEFLEMVRKADQLAHPQRGFEQP